MKIIIVHFTNILACPPVMNLVNMLDELNIETVLITTKGHWLDTSNYKNLHVEQLSVEYEKPRRLIKKFTDLFSIRDELWKIIDRYYDEDSIIWTTSNLCLKHLGNRIMGKRYILQFMELSENLAYYKKLPFLKLDEKRLGDNALAVVVPEYNRAHIIKAWWNLERRPMILSNKPYNKLNFVKENIVHNEKAKEVLEEIGNRKIILYQGIIHKERPLDKYIYAVDKLGDEYAFVLMTDGANVYENINTKNYYFIPYIPAPNHLEVTSHAYIGVLSYFPTKSQYSILNALYCAPNKTYEYAMFGIPMLGNDNPGLKYAFDTTQCGVCFEEYDVDAICNAIRKIENSYNDMVAGTKKYYESTDTLSQLKDIIYSASLRIKNG